MSKSFKPVLVFFVAAFAFEGMPNISHAKSLYISTQDTNESKKQSVTRKVPGAISLPFHRKLQKIQEKIDIGELDSALEMLVALTENSKRHDYELAVLWQMRAMIAFERDDSHATINAYEKILSFRESIPQALVIQIIYGLAQLEFREENYAQSLAYARQWEEEAGVTSIGVTQLTFIAQVHYQLADFQGSLTYLERAIQQAEQSDTIEAKENWYQLGVSAHWELGQFDGARGLLEVLIARWPKSNYWLQLAAAHQELGDEITSHAIMVETYKRGYLQDNPAQIVNVAQIKLARGAPIECAWVLLRSLRDELIDDNAYNQRLLGQCYLAASEIEKALEPLSLAAERDRDPDLWRTIAQLNIQKANFEEAAYALSRAQSLAIADQPKTKSFSLLLMYGQTMTELKRFDEALRLFEQAWQLADTKSNRSKVTNWRKYLASEAHREKILKATFE